MAGFDLFKGGNKHREHIRIRTESVEETARGTVQKASTVEVNAADNRTTSDLWVGLKLRKSQKVLSLVVDGKTWIGADSKLDPTATDQFNTVLTTHDPQEVWAGYRVDKKMKPGPGPFDTALELNKIFAIFPDAQNVAIAVCYAPEEGKPLKTQAVILGYSLVQAPTPDATTKKDGGP